MVGLAGRLESREGGFNAWRAIEAEEFELRKDKDPASDHTGCLST